MGPEQCNTLFLQTDTTIGIRNSVHIYSATFVGESELIIGVKQDNATASHAVPIGRDYPIHNTAHLMMLFEGEDDDDTFSPECGSDTNVVSCKSNWKFFDEKTYYLFKAPAGLEQQVKCGPITHSQKNQEKSQPPSDSPFTFLYLLPLKYPDCTTVWTNVHLARTNEILHFYNRTDVCTTHLG